MRYNRRMAHDHDSSYKYLFSRPELVRDLIAGFIPDDWLHSLDYSTLEKLPNEYVSDDFRRRADDIIWRVRAGEEWVYLYFMIEFQSGVDRYMALRVMTYLGLFYQDLVSRGDILADGRLPPVLPIVLYNGDSAWRAPYDIHDLIPPVPGLVEQFKPHVRYFLIDEHAHSDSELASQKNLVAALFRFEHTASPEKLPELVGLLREWLADQPELGKMMARWLRATLRRKTGSTIVLPELDDLQELKIMLAERMAKWEQEKEMQWMQQGMQKGMQQGKLEGEALALQRLLTKRFGSLSPSLRGKISAANTEQIETWFDAAIDAPDLETVFGSTQH